MPGLLDQIFAQPGQDTLGADPAPRALGDLARHQMLPAQGNALACKGCVNRGVVIRHGQAGPRLGRRHRKAGKPVTPPWQQPKRDKAGRKADPDHWRSVRRGQIL